MHGHMNKKLNYNDIDDNYETFIIDINPSNL